MVAQDLATQWMQSYPCKTKTSQETQKSLVKFLEPTRKPEVIYTDNSLEFGKACEDLSWNHCTSTPYRSQTNGIAERSVRRLKEWTSAVLLQSGLDKEWWADSMECHCYLRNIQDLLSGGKTPYERRFGIPFMTDQWKFRCQQQCFVKPHRAEVAGETCRAVGEHEKNACIVEADESMRIRMEGAHHRDHADHIVGKGMNSFCHYNLVHKFIPMPQAMKIPDAKAAVEKRMGKTCGNSGRKFAKVKNKTEAIAEARKKCITVHFASLMDICHLKNSELEPQFQKYKVESYSEETL